MSLVSAMRRATGEARSLPSGTVTFLLTDVEASSASWDADAAATHEEMRELEETTASCVVASHGFVIKSRGEGDSTFAVFELASDAVLSAVELQRTLLGSALNVRAAIHTGEARLRDGDYYGSIPNRAARLRNLAHGGQIVLSRVAAELAEPELPRDVTLIALGTFRIRDWPQVAHIFGVRAPGLPDEFPPLRILGGAQLAVMTVVSVDVVGSTPGMARLSDHELIDVHRLFARHIRSTFQAERGTFLKLLGDGCIAAFDDPLAAVRFAHGVVAKVDAPMRVALCPGIVELVDDDIVGRPLYTVYQLNKAAPIGRVVTNRALVELLGGSRMCFTALSDTGAEHELYAIDAGVVPEPV